jgi:hypothetical protein
VLQAEVEIGIRVILLVEDACRHDRTALNDTDGLVTSANEDSINESIRRRPIICPRSSSNPHPLSPAEALILGVTKTYGQRRSMSQALSGVDLRVNEGEFTRSSAQVGLAAPRRKKKMLDAHLLFNNQIYFSFTDSLPLPLS